MKKTILYFIGIIAGNLLILKFGFSQDNTRFLDLFGFVVCLICIFQFSIKFTGLFFKRDFSYNDITSQKSFKNKSNVKAAYITLLMLFLLIGLHLWAYKSYYKYQDELLASNGILTKAIITDKQWESRGKNSPSEYFIYYEYKHNGKLFKHSTANDKKEIGDTITVKILPDNPDNHIVIQNKTER
jgi:hypothetical protein